MFIYIYIYVYICEYVYTYLCIHIYTYTCIYTCIYMEYASSFHTSIYPSILISMYLALYLAFCPSTWGEPGLSYVCVSGWRCLPPFDLWSCTWAKWIYLYCFINSCRAPLKVPCTPKWFDFEFPLLKTTKLWVETRSCTWTTRIYLERLLHSCRAPFLNEAVAVRHVFEVHSDSGQTVRHLRNPGRKLSNPFELSRVSTGFLLVPTGFAHWAIFWFLFVYLS